MEQSGQIIIPELRQITLNESQVTEQTLHDENTPELESLMYRPTRHVKHQSS